MRDWAKVGRTPSSARDPLVALLRSLSTLTRDRTLVPHRPAAGYPSPMVSGRKLADTRADGDSRALVFIPAIAALVARLWRRSRSAVQRTRCSGHWYEAHGIGKKDVGSNGIWTNDEGTDKPFAVCIDNTNYRASLVPGKVYRIVPDARAVRTICITKTTLCLWISHRQ